MIIVTFRWMHLVPFVLGLAFLVLGILSLVAGQSGTGTVQLALAAAWILLGFKGRRETPNTVVSQGVFLARERPSAYSATEPEN